jgi:hypothetical protein
VSVFVAVVGVIVIYVMGAVFDFVVFVVGVEGVVLVVERPWESLSSMPMSTPLSEKSCEALSLLSSSRGSRESRRRRICRKCHGSR